MEKEHFRSAAKEQREQDQRQFEQQIQFLQGELRTAKDTANTKQQELISSHQDNARLSSELAHSRSEIHRLDTEVRSLRSTKEKLAVTELKNQQLSEHLAQAIERKTSLAKENENRADEQQKAIHAKQQLESELMATKAVLASHEVILQRLTASQAPPTKSTKTSGSIDNQNSLFKSEG